MKKYIHINAGYGLANDSLKREYESKEEFNSHIESLSENVLIVSCIMASVYVYYINTQKEKRGLIETLEESYFEGQRDALEGDIRIGKDECGNWKQTKSFWGNK